MFMQCNLWLKFNSLLSKTADIDHIALHDIDPYLEWIVESQPTAFEDEDLCWMDLGPLAAKEDASTSDALGGLKQADEVDGDDEDPSPRDDFRNIVVIFCCIGFFGLLKGHLELQRFAFYFIYASQFVPFCYIHPHMLYT